MLASDLQEDLLKLKDCDLVRYELKKSKLILTIVGDNEEEEPIKPSLEEALSDDEKEEDGEDDCCSEMNGHLMQVTFLGVDGFTLTGSESDNYKTLEVSLKGQELTLKYEGHSFAEEDKPLLISFIFTSYNVIELGKIDGPDV